MRGTRLALRATILACAAALTAVPAGPAGADPVQPGPVDEAGLRGAVVDLPTPAATAAFARVRDGARQVTVRGGARKLGSAHQGSPASRFRIASGTKMFTSVLVLQLARQGRLRLDAPVQRYLPGLLPSSYPHVPVRTLLDHTSGLPHSTEDAGWEDPATFVAHRFDRFTPEQVVATATSQPMAFEPGTRQEYNGVNHFIAGLLVERVTGASYGHVLQRRILRPLRLRATRLPEPEDATLPKPHVHTYLRVDDEPVDVTEQSPYGWAESGLVSTTRDLDRFLHALIRGRLLERRQQRLLFRVPDVPYVGDECPHHRACYSAGLQRTELPGGLVVWGKSGSVPGTSSGTFTTRDGRRSLTYAIHPLGNRDGSEGEVLQRLVTAAFGL
ncbi:serine hydrolase domain-containing protein [Nocardioides sp. YIM 152315]|uniref:serine hydrolase domain-containing protein n=1 Tax=Nocardioides sp. YIM 152315 TaxID=3031760 RepID=UPI0023DC4D16|nr:serine hydrolase domain-containing protein [Nocardioides sp. YIM 152315]MDF1603825.1 serine hydrolase [Nocardioides sp. YIM 152315]